MPYESLVSEAITRLQSPISDLPTLLSILCASLSAMGLLPPSFIKHNTAPFAQNTFIIQKHLSPIQHALLTVVAPAWLPTLSEQHLEPLLLAHFAPDAILSSSPAALYTALGGYSTVLSTPLSAFSLTVLAVLAHTYPIDRLHAAIFSRDSLVPSHKRTQAWEDAVRDAASVPSRVANHARTGFIPPELEPGTYYTTFCKRIVSLVASSSNIQLGDDYPLSFLLLHRKFFPLGQLQLLPCTIRLLPSPHPLLHLLWHHA